MELNTYEDLLIIREAVKCKTKKQTYFPTDEEKYNVINLKSKQKKAVLQLEFLGERKASCFLATTIGDKFEVSTNVSKKIWSSQCLDNDRISFLIAR